MTMVSLYPFCVVKPQADEFGYIDPREGVKQVYMLQCKKCHLQLQVKYPVGLPLANVVTDLKEKGWRFSATEGLVAWCPWCTEAGGS